MDLINYVDNFIKKHNINGNIAVGFSGGVDSSVLLDVLVKLNKKNNNLIINPIFFIHGDSLPTEESVILQLCNEKCNQYNLKLNVIELDLKKEIYKKLSAEAAGHLERQKYYLNSSYNYVFLGHHADDQTETVLSQLMRGAGKGMEGIKEKDGIFYRPLLNYTKENLREYLKNKNITFHEDLLNYNTEYTRNFWRHEIIPKLKEHYPSLNEKINFFAKKMQKTNKLMYDLAVLDGLDEFVKTNKYNIKIDTDRFENVFKYFLKEKFNKSLQANAWKEIEKKLLSKQKKPFNIEIDGNTINFKSIKGEWNITIEHKLKLIKNVKNI